MKVRVASDMDAVLKKAREATFKNLGYAGGVTRKIAQQSIKIDPQPSTPGNPPHSRKGLLKKAILYAVEREQQRVVVGPTANVVGPAAQPHEFGGPFRGQKYLQRPFIGPAFEKVKPRLPALWANSVK